MPHGKMSSASMLEAARRDVRDAEDRIRRQEAIVTEMEKAGQTEAAQLGRDLLGMMRSAFELMRRHLERLESGRR